jgi:predicted CxxxxCH...CXXCH cytochrome family protein
MSGPYHGTRHGSPTTGYAAAPITCQTCHYETVDPARTKPGGFYYLDTSGDYALEGGAGARTTYVKWQRTQCATCHSDTGSAPSSGGAVLPLRHVNGRPDVVFDPRPALPAGYVTGLPLLATADPIAPYYVTPFNVDLYGWTLAPGAQVRLAEDGITQVLTLSLEPAAYDPATRTCSNVGCHLSRQSLVDSGALGTPPPLRWGDEYKLFASCQYCHSML